MNERDAIRDKLLKLIERKDWSAKAVMPAGNCTDVTTHLAGLFLKTHARVILEALRRMD